MTKGTNQPGKRASKNDKGSTLFVLLAKKGELTKIKDLLKATPRVKLSIEALTAGFYFTLTHKRDLELVELFFSHGLEPNGKWTQFTPLTAAAMCSMPKLVELMIERGCKVNLAAADGNSPLLACCVRGSENRNTAVRDGCIEVAKLLIAELMSTTPTSKGRRRSTTRVARLRRRGTRW